MDKFAILVGLIHFAALVVLGCMLLETTATYRNTLSFQTRLFLWAMALRFAVSLALYEGGLVNVVKDEDGQGFIVGAAFFEQWTEQGRSFLDTPALFLESYSQHHKGYYYLIGVIFMFTGAPDRLAAAAINCFVGALTVIIVYRLARSLFSERAARRAGWLACLMPSLILWSAQTLKEPVVIFLETLAVYACVRLKQSGFSFRYILLVCLAGVLLYPFRFYAGYIVIGTVLASLLFPQADRGPAQIASLLTIALLVVTGLFFTGGSNLKEKEEQSLDLKYLENTRRYGAEHSGSGVLIDADLQTPTGFATCLVVGAVHLLFAPFPWQWGGGTRMALAIPEVVLWWGILFYGVVPGFWYCVRRRLNDIIPLLLFVLVMGSIYSVTFYNLGLLYRYRAQLFPLLLIFAAVGMELRRAWKSGEEPDLEPALDNAPEAIPDGDD